MTRKEHILKVAQEEFSKHGFAAVSMIDSVDKLDLNKATIYYHYKDKKTLYHTVIKNAMKKSNSNIKAIFIDDASMNDNADLLRAYVNATILTIKDNPHIIPIALRELANYGANIDESFIPFIEEEINCLKTVINKLDLKDEYNHMNMFTLYAFIHGTINTFYAIQMSALPLGDDGALKLNSEKTLDFISEFISNIILDALVKK